MAGPTAACKRAALVIWMTQTASTMAAMAAVSPMAVPMIKPSLVMSSSLLLLLLLLLSPPLEEEEGGRALFWFLGWGVAVLAEGG